MQPIRNATLFVSRFKVIKIHKIQVYPNATAKMLSLKQVLQISGHGSMVIPICPIRLQAANFN